MCPKLGHIYFIGTESSSKHDFLKDNLIDAGTNIVHLLYPRHLIASLQLVRDAPFFFHLLHKHIALFRCSSVDVSEVFEEFIREYQLIQQDRAMIDQMLPSEVSVETDVTNGWRHFKVSD